MAEFKAHFKFRMDEVERAWLNKLAENAGLTPSAWLRRAINRADLVNGGATKVRETRSRPGSRNFSSGNTNKTDLEPERGVPLMTPSRLGLSQEACQEILEGDFEKAPTKTTIRYGEPDRPFGQPRPAPAPYTPLTRREPHTPHALPCFACGCRGTQEPGKCRVFTCECHGPGVT